jgi:hypothetical protein
MLDFGALPPEVNSGRMYVGAGSGPMMAAASAWDALASQLDSVSRGYSAVIVGLQGENWSGGASIAMADAAPCDVRLCRVFVGSVHADAVQRAAVDHKRRRSIPSGRCGGSSRRQLNHRTCSGHLVRVAVDFAATAANPFYGRVFGRIHLVVVVVVGVGANTDRLPEFQHPCWAGDSALADGLLGVSGGKLRNGASPG